MKPHFFVFEYSTRCVDLKRISYTSCTTCSAMKRFGKNTRFTKLFKIWKDGFLILG